MPRQVACSPLAAGPALVCGLRAGFPEPYGASAVVPSRVPGPLPPSLPASPHPTAMTDHGVKTVVLGAAGGVGVGGLGRPPAPYCLGPSCPFPPIPAAPLAAVWAAGRVPWCRPSRKSRMRPLRGL
ncbi:hypothetical protein OV450_5788 [Actinobacteria bacterium OV450]|nr:hypothetical protein OV450_5788 [Actinobacteria bacterium OV450]